MKTPILWLTAFFIIMPTAYAQNENKPATEDKAGKDPSKGSRVIRTHKIKWEYKAMHVIYRSGSDREAAAITTSANTMGLDGWNLVSTVKIHSSSQLLLIFKRPKP